MGYMCIFHFLSLPTRSDRMATRGLSGGRAMLTPADGAGMAYCLVARGLLRAALKVALDTRRRLVTQT